VDERIDPGDSPDDRPWPPTTLRYEAGNEIAQALAPELREFAEKAAVGDSAPARSLPGGSPVTEPRFPGAHVRLIAGKPSPDVPAAFELTHPTT